MIVCILLGGMVDGWCVEYLCTKKKRSHLNVER